MDSFCLQLIALLTLSKEDVDRGACLDLEGVLAATDFGRVPLPEKRRRKEKDLEIWDKEEDAKVEEESQKLDFLRP